MDARGSRSIHTGNRRDKNRPERRDAERYFSLRSFTRRVNVNEDTTRAKYIARNEGRRVPLRHFGISAFRHFGPPAGAMAVAATRRALDQRTYRGCRKEEIPRQSRLYWIRLTSRRAMPEMLRPECQKFQEEREREREREMENGPGLNPVKGCRTANGEILI